MYYFLPEHLVREATNQGRTHGPRIPLNEQSRLQFNFVWKQLACCQ